MPVEVAPVFKGDLPVTLKALGTVTPLATATVRTQISGQLTDVAFQEGQIVSPGDFLAQIDPRPYQVALEQAEAQLAKDQAALHNAQRDLERYSVLVGQNSLARQQRDMQAALVAQNQATVQSDEALINTQKLNLVYAHIVAPIAGRIGLRIVDPGNYVQPSDPNGIAVITQLQPISVIFTLSENNLQVVAARLKTHSKLPVAAYDRTGATELATGRLETVDNQMDLSTATVKLRAVFGNLQGNLFPNQFVNIRIQVDSFHDVILVPAVAVQHGAAGDFVYVVRPDDTVAMQTVHLGPGDARRRVVVSGLQTGDQVVVDGADSLHEGAKVAVVSSADEAGTARDEPPQSRGHGRGQGGGHGRGQGGGRGGDKAAPKAGAPSEE
jgi:membrane fusion protein, multidrug efflux system